MDAPRGAIQLERLAQVLNAEINPGAARRDRKGAPYTAADFERLRETGVLGATLPGAIGGAELDGRAWGYLLRWLGYASEEIALPFILSAQQSLANLLWRTERRDLIERWVIPMSQGQRLVSFCWSEGSDPFSFKTTLARDGARYTVDGGKAPITGAQGADLFLVYARAADGDDTVAVLIERGDPGVEVRPRRLMGLRATGQGNLMLRGVSVPTDRVIVGSDAIGHAQRFLNERRSALACITLGKLEALFERMVKQLRSRKRFRLPLSEMQAVQASLGQFFVALQASRAMVGDMLERQRGVSLAQPGATWDPTTTGTKYFVVEQMSRCVQLAQRLLGGNWYYEDDEPFGRWMRDLQGFVPAAGTQAILEVDLGVWSTHGPRSPALDDALASLRGDPAAG